jgi:arylsulfatase A-like enzyme
VGYRKPVLEPPPPGPHYRGERPNILLVVVDDLAAGVVGRGSRFPFLETPHINRLEGEGVPFPQAFVPTAVCSPSRASLLTGTYAHTHGVRVNDVEDLSEMPPNFPSLLKRAGYETGFVGKWHMDSAYSGPRLDFDTWLSFAGQGVYENPVLNENGREFQERGYVTDTLSRYAAAWLQRPRDRPFCLIVSHKAAHVPFEAAARHRFAFAGAELPEPANFNDTLEGKPAWQRRYKLCGLHPDTWALCDESRRPGASAHRALESARLRPAHLLANASGGRRERGLARSGARKRRAAGKHARRLYERQRLFAGRAPAIRQAHDARGVDPGAAHPAVSQ